MNIFKPLCKINLHAFEHIRDDGLHRVCERCGYHEKIKELTYTKDGKPDWGWVQELGGIPKKPYNCRVFPKHRFNVEVSHTTTFEER